MTPEEIHTYVQQAVRDLTVIALKENSATEARAAVAHAAYLAELEGLEKHRAWVRDRAAGDDAKNAAYQARSERIALAEERIADALEALVRRGAA